MTNADASKQHAHASHAKKRHWREGAGGAFVRPASPVRSDLKCVVVDAKPRRPPPSFVQLLPLEVTALVLAFLDGHSLLKCSAVCRVLARLSHDRHVWKNICVKTWPTLNTQTLPQLPGAPDYDLIRLYGGSWRRCFVEQHRLNQRAELRVDIPNFSQLPPGDRVESETFVIGEHRFCLWIFPHGNPNEPQYAGRVLSVYLVLTDLDRRPADWLTCAVFSLCVVNHKDPTQNIEWHSCLVDNKFDARLNNWGVHSLGALKTIRNPEMGYMVNDTLSVSVRVRLMSITFRVVMEDDLKRHHHLGLTDLTTTKTITLPFCASLQDLLHKLESEFEVDPDAVNIWCFNQPVISGQALRPRKLLTSTKATKTRPMFGHLLADGIDIDAYSCCQIYVERKNEDDAPLNASSMNDSATDMDTSSDEEEATESLPSASRYLFVKALHPHTQKLDYLGRYCLDDTEPSTSSLYESIAARLGCEATDLLLFKEEITPVVFSGPITASPCAAVTSCFDAADIVIVAHKRSVGDGSFDRVLRSLLLSQYHAAEDLLFHRLQPPTLEQIENLAERLDIPKFRVRSAFRKCHEDGQSTLRYIMEGRHLGFICDCCGETDFQGPRFNCTSCSDYDLCRNCHVTSREVSHRYANVDGKWQRIYDFREHASTHGMREMLPVFFQYEAQVPSQHQNAAAW
ncbi:hypothetical protein Poli38472_006133 [Pythium oligandrum]|uniref:Uncharacterized protein n=1 Tax=Pythium oligandrum TaxID=41045 RepID=A0A8K1CSC7_PYTOL|nr:hypothetical protein Poli38472_006133 [Pythium oligandrum]|eukprot:TMW68665.1 hypothetical protein Poli38472_006133 [Pythium oligandrum]